MTIGKFKKIIEQLPSDTVILLDDDNISEVETVIIEYNDNGEPHLFLSEKE